MDFTEAKPYVVIAVIGIVLFLVMIAPIAKVSTELGFFDGDLDGMYKELSFLISKTDNATSEIVTGKWDNLTNIEYFRASKDMLESKIKSSTDKNEIKLYKSALESVKLHITLYGSIVSMLVFLVLLLALSLFSIYLGYTCKLDNDAKTLIINVMLTLFMFAIFVINCVIVGRINSFEHKVISINNYDKFSMQAIASPIILTISLLSFLGMIYYTYKEKTGSYVSDLIH